eukprot:7730655-Pyramimonas_sp.AAC.1
MLGGARSATVVDKQRVGRSTVYNCCRQTTPAAPNGLTGGAGAHEPGEHLEGPVLQRGAAPAHAKGRAQRVGAQGDGQAVGRQRPAAVSETKLKALVELLDGSDLLQ